MIEPGHDTPDLEDLAAYFDGRLSAERRAQVEERLVRDEDYYDVFLENVHALQEKADERDGGEVELAAGRRPWRVAAEVATVAGPLAVAAALVAAIGLSLLRGRGPSTGEWVARLDATAVVGWGKLWDDPSWERSRSGGPEVSLLTPEQLAFRIGTRTVDLRVALAGDDLLAVKRASTQLATLTNARIDLLLFSSGYEDLTQRIDSDPLVDLTTKTADLEAYLAEALEDSPEAGNYHLGQWNEAGRLAALSSDAEVLAGVFRRKDRSLPLSANDKIAPHLAKIEAVVEKTEPGAEDFKAAAVAFSEIARAMAGRV